MAITKEQILDYIHIDEVGVMEVQRATYFIEDGVRSERTKLVRATFIPDQPLNTVPAGLVRQIASLVWTPEVIAAYQAAKVPVP